MADLSHTALQRSPESWLSPAFGSPADGLAPNTAPVRCLRLALTSSSAYEAFRNRPVHHLLYQESITHHGASCPGRRRKGDVRRREETAMPRRSTPRASKATTPVRLCCNQVRGLNGNFNG